MPLERAYNPHVYVHCHSCGQLVEQRATGRCPICQQPTAENRNSPVTEATADLLPLISRLAEINQHKGELEAEEKRIKADLRAQLDVGTKVTVNGSEVLAIRSHRRWDNQLASTVIPPELQPLCTVTAIDSKRAKAVLPPALYDACLKSYEPQVVLL